MKEKNVPTATDEKSKDNTALRRTVTKELIRRSFVSNHSMDEVVSNIKKTALEKLKGNKNFNYQTIGQVLAMGIRLEKTGKSESLYQGTVFREIESLACASISYDDFCEEDQVFKSLIQDFKLRHFLLTALPAEKRTFVPVPLHDLLEIGRQNDLRLMKFYSGSCKMDAPFARVAIALLDPLTLKVYILTEFRNIGQVIPETGKKKRENNESFQVRSFVFHKDHFRSGSHTPVQLEYWQPHRNNKIGFAQKFDQLILSDREFYLGLESYRLSFWRKRSMNKEEQEIQFFHDVFSARLKDSKESYMSYVEAVKRTPEYADRFEDPLSLMMRIRDIARTGRVLGYDEKTKRPKLSKMLWKNVPLSEDEKFDQQTWNQFFFKQIKSFKK